MNRILIASALLAGTISAASAADVYTPDSLKDTFTEDQYTQSYGDWNGLYAGVNGGYGWGYRGTSLNENCKGNNYPGSGKVGAKIPCFDPGVVDLENEGWLAGVTVGANAQRGSVVFGIEADVAMTGIEGSDTISTVFHADPVSPDHKNGYNWDIDSEIEYFGTLRGRAGVLLNPTLLAYATGGAAWARVNETHQTYDHNNGVPQYATSGFTSEATNDHFGWTAGGGMEWEFQAGWTLKGEYLYVDLGEVDYVQGSDVTSSELNMHILRAGLNYRF
jgi:outer membrane immunogenic protein